MIYVISKDGQPLMPTKCHGKVKHMLRDGRAKVVQRTPFTIRLTYESTTYTQPIALGIDAGSKTVGISATTDDEELYSAELTLRNDIVDLLSTRRQFRSARRNRKTRYRQPRFNNRRKPKGWVAPSIQHKIDTHLKAVAQIHNILPITHIIVEVAAFDIQKIKNPDVSGEKYQQGDQLGFWNVREYVLFRDGHKCQHCKGKSKDRILNVHHIESRKTGGDAPNNLITLCETCHDKHHDGEIKLKVKRGASFKDTAFIGIMRWAFYNRLKELYPNVNLTYGYITKNTRIRNGLEKSHRTDARCIANVKATSSDIWYRQKAVRRNNRSLHKATINKGGYRKANQAPKFVYGFQLFDKVRYGGQECFVFSRRTSGYFDLRMLDGTKVHASANYKKLKLLETANTILFERRTRIPPPPIEVGVSCAT